MLKKIYMANNKPNNKKGSEKVTVYYRVPPVVRIMDPDFQMYLKRDIYKKPARKDMN